MEQRLLLSVTSLSWHGTNSANAPVISNVNPGQTVYIKAIGDPGTYSITIYEEEDFFPPDATDDEIASRQITIGSSGYGFSTGWNVSPSPNDQSSPWQSFYSWWDRPFSVNNVESARLRINPDLQVIDMQLNGTSMPASVLSAPSVRVGQGVRLDFLGKNVGPGSAPVNTPLAWYYSTSSGSTANPIDNGVLGSINGLAPGEMEWETDASWTIPNRTPGTYWLTAKIDPSNSVPETNNDNNVLSRPFKIINEAPTDISLSNNTVQENQPSNTLVGTFTTTDPNLPNDSHTYNLVSGSGSTDNGSFTVSGNQLRTTANFNYEAKSSYTIRVRSTDQGELPVEKAFPITITNVNEAPTNIVLSNNNVPENQPPNTNVGTFSTTDPDSGNTFTYALVTGIGSTDNGSFTISGNQLRTATSFNYEVKSNFSIRVRSTDQGGLPVEKAFPIVVTNVNEPPTPPGMPVASDITSTSAKISWTASTDPEGDTITYEIQYQKDDFNPLWSSPSFTKSTFYTLTGLQPDKSYHVRVRASEGKANGTSDWTTKNNLFTTLPVPQVVISDASLTLNPTSEYDPNQNGFYSKFRVNWSTGITSGSKSVYASVSLYDEILDKETWMASSPNYNVTNISVNQFLTIHIADDDRIEKGTYHVRVRIYDAITNSELANRTERVDPDLYGLKMEPGGDGTQLPAGKWTTIIHGLSNDPYADLVADSGWMMQMAKKLWIESRNVAVHTIETWLGSLNTIVSKGRANLSSNDLSGSWQRTDVAISDPNYHHVLLFDWAEVSNYFIGDPGMFMNKVEHPPGGASGDDGYAEAAADVLYGLLQWLPGAEHAVVGFSRGAVVASEVAQRILVDNDPATTISQVTFLDAEGGGSSPDHSDPRFGLYTDDRYYAWSGTTTQNYYSTFDEGTSAKWIVYGLFPSVVSILVGQMIPDVDLGGHIVDGALNYSTGALPYLHDGINLGVVREFYNYFTEQTFIATGLTRTKDTPSSFTGAAKNPSSGAYDPPVQFELFNGDFEYADSTAGWWYHGSSYADNLGTVANGRLRLDQNEYRIHNWSYVPNEGKSLEFDVQVDDISHITQLGVFWEGNDGFFTELGRIGLTNAGNLADERVNLPLNAPGSTGRITFAMIGQDPARAYVDNISWSATNVPPLPGDYHKNGTVDVRDLVLWRNTRGNTVVPYSGADGNGNGIIDQADYAIWRANFGRSRLTRAAGSFAFAGIDPQEETSVANDNTERSILRQQSANDLRPAFAVNFRAAFDGPALLGARRVLAPSPRPSIAEGRDALLAAMLDSHDAEMQRPEPIENAYDVADETAFDFLDAIDEAFELLAVSG